MTNKKYVAYLRVSTKTQDLSMQVQYVEIEKYMKLINADISMVFFEKESGKNNKREALSFALKYCKEQKATLVVSKLDRLSRSVSFLFGLHDSEIDFIVLDMPNLNTLTLAIFAGFAQYERETIAERTKKALQIKKEKGFKLGRPIKIDKSKKITDTMWKFYQKLPYIQDKNVPVRKVANLLNEGNYRTFRNKIWTFSQVYRIRNYLKI